MKDTLPTHVGIIMDGNGRWATARNLPRNVGHKKGADAFEAISRYALKIGLPYLSVFAFSTENFSRPKEEVDAILNLMRDYLKRQKRQKNLEVRLRFLGDLKALPSDIQEDARAIEESTRHFSKLQLNVAFNYGGRQDILRAATTLARQYKEGTVTDLERLTHSDFAQLLYTSGQPDLDLLIRTSGEQRISNFLLWQAAYAEFVFTKTLWPDFTPQVFDECLKEYQERDRRLGGL